MDTTNRLVVLSKRDQFLRLLGKGVAVRVAVDGRGRGVELPSEFLREPEVPLIFTKHDVNVDAGPNDLTAVLKFKGKAFPVKIPWSSIFIIADDSGDGLLWEDDAPAAVVDRLTKTGLVGSKVSGPLDSSDFRVIDQPFKTTQVS
jgi:stringent starvation protein B